MALAPLLVQAFPGTITAETTSVAGEHRVSECGEQEMEQQDEH